ncbi:MAG: hypothetical protein ACMUIU_00185 [bacterium]
MDKFIKKFHLTFIVSVALSLIIGYAVQIQAAPGHRINGNYFAVLQSFSKDNPQKILFLPVKLKMSEMSSGGVIEEVSQWSEQASENSHEAIFKYFASIPAVDIIDMVELTPEEQMIFDEHLALYDLICNNAYVFSYSSYPAWRHKEHHFDYTLGKGLNFLKEKTGADTCLFITGSDVIPTSGRKAMGVAGVIFGVPVSLGSSFLAISVVDLATGDIVWFNHRSGREIMDMRKPEDAYFTLRDILKDYPGLNIYLENYPEAKLK